MAVIHRLSVHGRDYFLSGPVDDLQRAILQAIQAGGGYVRVPGLRSDPPTEVLFSPGLAVVWAQIEVAGTEEH